MLDAIREALIIFNPRAGRARGANHPRLESARMILARHGIETELATTDAPGAATALARQAVSSRRQMVIVCGGDGTVNEVVNGLAGSSVPLALLPAGTANVLAKELGLPWNIEKAASLLARSELRRIALGLLTTDYRPKSTASGASAVKIDGRPSRYFLSVGGAGPDGAIINAVSHSLKAYTGTLAYWAEGFRQLAGYGFPPFRVTVAGRTMEPTLIVVGRTKHYGGPFRITTEANLFDNQFELMLCTARSPLRYLSYIPLAWAGRLRESRHVHFVKASEVRCEPLNSEREGPGSPRRRRSRGEIDESPIYLQVDGEPAGCLPAEFRIVPDALTLAVPGRSD